MIPEERREKILFELSKNNILTIESLVKKFKVSKMTIQRDITILKINNQLEKIHGGVKATKKTNYSIGTRFIIRMNQEYEKKLEIAKKAIDFVKDGETIFIDSSTTCYIFAIELLKNKFNDLTIITTSPSIICEYSKFTEISNIRLISTGGSYRQDYNMFYGALVRDFLNKINIDSSFISAAGFSSDFSCITSSDIDLTNILKIVFENSNEINLLMDSSKFIKRGMIEVDNVSKCRRIITNNDLGNNIIENFKQFDMLELVF